MTIPGPDLTPPPTPTGFTVDAAISHVFVEHDAPVYRQGHGHLRTRLYGKIVNAGDPLPTFADAVEIAQFAGTVYAHPSNPATTWRLWIKWETVDGVLSVDPAGGTNGLEAVTGQDVALLLKALEGEITESQLYTDLSTKINDSADGVSYLGTQNGIRVQASSDGKTVIGGFGVMGSVDAENGPTIDFGVLANSFYIAAPATATGVESAIPFIVQTTATTINGVDVPAGVYMRDAFIQNGTITNAKIANLAVDDAKIASLSATKLTAGQLQVGSWISSSNYVAGAQGWAINSDGTAELSNAVVRGTVYATSGEFSGTVKAGATILGGLAASYSSGAGFYGGLESGAYKWRVGSPTGARIQWTGAAIEVYDASNKLTISSGGVDWGSVTGQGRPADGATVGAPAGTYVGDKLAESLVADVLGAVSAASNASSDATAALDLISDISSDSKFTPIERLAARKEWDEIAGEWFGIYASGGNFGLTALQEAYQAATRALGSYLNGAPWISFDVIPAGISEAYLNATTEINSTEFRSKFKDYYTARQALLNAVADVAATRATWPSVTGEGRPADGATVGATFGVNISGQITPSNASTYIANAAIGTAHIADAAINSAKIGSASIMTANIGEAQVNTLQIAGNAVTIPEVATGDSTIAGNGEYQYILGTQITISEPGMVMASFAAKQDFPNGGRRWDVKLYIDGVERFYTYGGIANDSISMAGALYISTAKTVNISVYWKGADEYCYVKNRCLWAMGAKR